MDGEVMVDVDKMATILERTESLSKAVKEYKRGGEK